MVDLFLLFVLRFVLVLTATTILETVGSIDVQLSSIDEAWHIQYSGSWHLGTKIPFFQFKCDRIVGIANFSQRNGARAGQLGICSPV